MKCELMTFILKLLNLVLEQIFQKLVSNYQYIKIHVKHERVDNLEDVF